MADTALIRVLVADDDPALRQLVAVALVEAGIYVVASAANGREAVACTELLEPDVVLMNHHLPVLDGIAATRLIRAAHSCQVVLYSDANSEALAPAAYAAGAALVLAADGLPHALAPAIRHAFTLRGAMLNRTV